MDFKKISVVGLGYIGLPTAAMFASIKIKVVGLDVDEEAVKTINQGKIHIVEPDLDLVVHTAVSEGYLRATTAPEPAEAFLVAVPTPFQGNNHEPDLSYIKAASKSISKVLKKGDLVILESTSPVGSTEKMAGWLAEQRPDLSFPETHGEDSDVRVAYCPERVLPGQILRELVENDRVIGGLTSKCSAYAVALYDLVVSGECIITNARTAEMAKLTENSFRDVNIAFANEISMICDTLGINVWELVELTNRHPRVNILKPSPGVGGHCIAVDPWFIVSKTPDQAQLIKTARQVNIIKPDWVISRINAEIGNFLQQNTARTSSEIIIALYGLTFKPDIDDLRESPALYIAKKLNYHYHGQLIIVEPNIFELPKSLDQSSLVEKEYAFETADIHIMLVSHKEFMGAPKPSGNIVDACGIWE